MKQGIRPQLLVITGTGKGKTSTAFGIAFQEAVQHKRVCIVQFLKSDGITGEFVAMQSALPNVCLIQTGRSCSYSQAGEDISWSFAYNQKDQELCHSSLDTLKTLLTYEDFDLIILDEVNVAIDMGLISLGEVLALYYSLENVETLVCTGRKAPKELMRLAHSTCYLEEIKHPYQKGILAREGIEY